MGLFWSRTDRFVVLADHGIFRNHLQVHHPKFVYLSHFLRVQLLHPYITTGKNIALAILIFFASEISLSFKIFPKFVKAFLPWISLLFTYPTHCPSLCILDHKKIKLSTISSPSPSTSKSLRGKFDITFVFLILSVRPNFALSNFNFLMSSSKSSSFFANSHIICIS